MGHVPTIRVGKHGNLTFSKRGWPKGFRSKSMKADYAAAKGMKIGGGVEKPKAKGKIKGAKTNTEGHWITANGRHIFVKG